MSGLSETVPTLRWLGGIDGHLRLLDQTRLPTECVEIDCRDVEAVWEAIRNLRVRGAPAIGIAAAYGVCLGMQWFRLTSQVPSPRSDCAVQTPGTWNLGPWTLDLGPETTVPQKAQFHARVTEVCSYLATSRPTAVNLFWALDRMKGAAADLPQPWSAQAAAERLLAEAQAIHEEDRQMCRAIGRHGAALLRDGQGVLTHCNAGGLATSDYGTALAVFFTAHDEGKRLHVFADETRPLLQGARLTAWELKQRGIDVTLICDSMAAQVMREGRVQAVVVGADRIAANGDTANKIGTYAVALAAAAHEIPFYVAAPTSTFDLSLRAGDAIPIEQRPAAEITHGFGPTASRSTTPPSTSRPRD
jgi:methylthioribose-1-phosphate isomerase